MTGEELLRISEELDSMIKFLPLDNVQSIIVPAAVMRPPYISAPVSAPSARDRDVPYAYPRV
jgi:hypothetical protein